MSARVSPYRTALVLAALAAAQLACGSSPAASGPASNAEAADGLVSVDARITGFTLSAGSAPAGAVTFSVDNSDVLPHNFTITGNGLEEATAQLAPGDTATLTVDLPAGDYTYFCAVEGHREAGMVGTFTIK